MKKDDLRPEYRRFCAVLRSMRRGKSISQIELAEKLRVPQSYVSKIETGERRVDYIELRRICMALGISMAKFEDAFEKYQE